MIEVPKLVFMVLVGFLVWYAVRWVNGPPRKPGRRPQAPPPRPQAGIEDLTACRTCGAYVAASARGCGKAGCPQPR